MLILIAETFVRSAFSFTHTLKLTIELSSLLNYHSIFNREIRMGLFCRPSFKSTLLGCFRSANHIRIV